MIVKIPSSSGEAARNHNLIAIHFFLLLLLKPNSLAGRNSRPSIHRVDIHSRGGLALLVFSSPQPLHGLLHHIRDQSPQLVNSHLHHDEILRGGLLLLRRCTASSQVIESRRAHCRRRRRQTAQERIDGFGRRSTDS